MGFFDKIINSFFNSYKEGLEKQMIDTTKERDPKLAQTLSNVDAEIQKALVILRARLNENERKKVKDPKPVRSEQTVVSSKEKVTERINESDTVQIGSQEWMRRNLDVSTFRNGDAIPEVRTNEEWMLAGKNGQPAWCHVKNDDANDAKYGKLYNWYAVTDPRGLAPERYHIPSDDEWEKLIEFLGAKESAGKKMKSKSGWKYGGVGLNGTNESGFSGFPSGYRDTTEHNTFSCFGTHGLWWSSTESNSFGAYFILLSGTKGNTERPRPGLFKYMGLSVRCIKRDNPTPVSNAGLSPKN